jgi:hypothetical protein
MRDFDVEEELLQVYLSRLSLKIGFNMLLISRVCYKYRICTCMERLSSEASTLLVVRMTFQICMS